MIRWTGLSPWEFEFRFPGSLTSTFPKQVHQFLITCHLLNLRVAPGTPDLDSRNSAQARSVESKKKLSPAGARDAMLDAPACSSFEGTPLAALARE